MSQPLEQPYTISSIVTEVQDVLFTYTRGQEQKTSLAEMISDTDLAFKVSNSDLLSRGLTEIDDELVYVGMVDLSTGNATIEPWGRAQSGTTATTHATGARVTIAPLYPRHRVANIVVGVLREIFPSVFAVAQTELDINPARSNYVLPADAYQVLSAEWNWPGPSGLWAPVHRWRQNKPVEGLEIEILSPVWPGEGRARIKYMLKPPADWNIDGDLNADYGYDHEIRDLIVLGATSRALGYTEPSRLQVHSVESHARAEMVPAGALIDGARYLFAQFRQRLDDERAQILLRHPIQSHRTR